MEKSAITDRSKWKLEVMSFEEAEAQTRNYWQAATTEERLNGLEALREQLYGEDQTIQRIQRVLTLVPQTRG